MPNPSIFARLLGPLTLLASGATLIACSSSHKSNFPYDADMTNVIGGMDSGGGSSSGIKGSDGGGGFDNATGPVGTTPVSTVTTSTGEGCTEPDSVCEAAQDAAQKACGDDAATDVILGRHGEVLTTLCYPTDGWDVTVLGADPVSTPPLENNTVVVIDGEDDGVDITGDVTIKGNNSIIWGEGPDVSVIGGDVNIEKNNAIVRGVRIKGNATITKNNAALVDCVIEGDLTVTLNNISVALCEIWGKVNIQGNNAYFVSNLVAGDQKVTGKNLQCNDNHSFTDSDGDHVVAADEVLAPIECGEDSAAAATPGTKAK
jgi:hypothetical protein